jgi:hypothetical protein
VVGDLFSEDDDRLTFQHNAHQLRDELERVLADGYGDVWLDWSGDAGRMKVAVTTRCDPSVIAAAEQLIDNSPISERVDLVRVIWSARELTEGKERLVAALNPAVKSVSLIGVDPTLNSVVLWASNDSCQADSDALGLAIHAATVTVQVVVNDVRFQTGQGKQSGVAGSLATSRLPATELEEVTAGNAVPVVLTVQNYEPVDGGGLLLCFELANRAPTPVLCGAEFALDQLTGSRWVAVNVGRSWPAIGYQIPPRRRRVSRCRLPADLPAGRYRLQKEVGIEIDGAKERGQRPFHERARLTAEFTID